MIPEGYISFFLSPLTEYDVCIVHTGNTIFCPFFLSFLSPRNEWREKKRALFCLLIKTRSEHSNSILKKKKSERKILHLQITHRNSNLWTRVEYQIPVPTTVCVCVVYVLDECVCVLESE